MNARKILKKLDYLPKWAWYLLSFFIAGPFGMLGVYLAFHVLGKMAQEQAEEEREAVYARRAGAHRRKDVYEDAECVVSSDEDVNREWAQTQSSAARAATQTHRTQNTQQPIDENADVAEVIRGGYDALRRIRQANDIIEDPALSAQIDSIENSCAQILAILEERQQLLPQLRTFLRYYLPTTLRLLDARASLENHAGSRKAREVRARISEALGVIDKALRKQVDALDEYRFIDLESEIDVLRDMLKADGLIDEDKDDDPFAGMMGSH